MLFFWTVYHFYINLKPIYALILLASTLITFFCGLLLERNAESVRKKKTILTASLVLNFSMLFVFKYYNFINGSIESLMSSVGLRWNVPYLNVLLPVGISFFTFQAAGYIIDVYRGTVKAEKNFLTYALFVSFFPVILAGPIQRAIIPVLIMFIVTAVETVGDISGVTEGGFGREATDKELSGGVICDLYVCFYLLPNHRSEDGNDWTRVFSTLHSTKLNKCRIECRILSWLPGRSAYSHGLL